MTRVEEVSLGMGTGTGNRGGALDLASKIQRKSNIARKSLTSAGQTTRQSRSNFAVVHHLLLMGAESEGTVPSRWRRRGQW